MVARLFVLFLASQISMQTDHSQSSRVSCLDQEPGLFVLVWLTATEWLHVRDVVRCITRPGPEELLPSQFKGVAPRGCAF